MKRRVWEKREFLRLEGNFMTFPCEGKFTSSHFFASKDVMGRGISEPREGPWLKHDFWSTIYLFTAKRIGEEERTRERTLQKQFWTPAKGLLVFSVLAVCTGKEKNNHARGGLKTHPLRLTKGGPKLVLARAVLREVFSALSFPLPHAAHGVLCMHRETESMAMKFHGDAVANFGRTFWPFLPRNPTFPCAVATNFATFLCSELGPLSGSFRQLGDFRQFAWAFQAISGNLG